MTMMVVAIVDGKKSGSPSPLELALQRLQGTHLVRMLDVGGLSGPDEIARCAGLGQADVYLMKSRAPQALDVARHVEQRGGQVVNGSKATLACLDRAWMTARLREADIPQPETWDFATLDSLRTRGDLLAALPFPWMIKSRASRRGDLVVRVGDVRQLHDLGTRWDREPVIVQAFEANDGWDLKVWVIDENLFAARRRTPLGPGGSKENFPIAAGLPEAVRRLALKIGRVFGLLLYGVDFVETVRGPVVVDVNAFPGFRGWDGAGSALATLVERLSWWGKASP